MANTFTSLRVGVDWSNKGVVCMGSRPTDPQNIIPGSIYYQSHPTYAENGTLIKTYHPASDYPVAGAVKWTWNVGQNGIMWMFRDSGTTRSLTVSPSTAYTMYVSYRPEPATFWDGTIQAMGWNGATWDVLKTANGNSGDHDLTRYGDTSSVVHRQVQLTFTTASNHSRVAVKFTSAAWGAGNRDLNINGYMLVAGTYETEANGGVQLWWNCYADDPTCLHDDVTDFLMSADYSIGKTEWDQALPSEGTATIILRNDSKKFSPERTEFIGGFIVNRRVLIERAVTAKAGAASPPLFQLQWSGWVKNLQPKTNIYGERTATLEALQGWYNIEKIPVTPVLKTSVKTGTAMLAAISSGYELPTNPAFAKVGYSLVNNTWLIDPAVILPNYDSGIILDFSGMYWKNGSNALEILNDLIDFENNWFFMNKYGALHFIPAATITAASATTSLAPTDIQNLEYKYGNELWTSIRCTPLLQTLTPFNPNDAIILSDTVEVEIAANSILNIETPYTYNNAYTPNGKSYGSQNDQILSAVRVDDPSTSVTVGGLTSGLSVRVGFVGQSYDGFDPSFTWAYQAVYWAWNTNAFPIKLSITTTGYGWEIIGAENIVETVDNTLSNRYGYLVRNVENQYLQNTTLTADYITRKMQRYSNPYGWFPVIKIVPDNATISAHANDLTVGRVWEITSEAQTIDSSKTMVVIGESTHWMPQHLEKTVYSSPKF
jgi:hypothetical protein